MVAAARATPPAEFWYLHLTEPQKAALQELTIVLNAENALLPGLDDACTLLRFLKARQWCPAKAAKMYRVRWVLLCCVLCWAVCLLPGGGGG